MDGPQKLLGPVKIWSAIEKYFMISSLHVSELLLGIRSFPIKNIWGIGIAGSHGYLHIHNYTPFISES